MNTNKIAWDVEAASFELEKSMQADGPTYCLTLPDGQYLEFSEPEAKGLLSALSFMLDGAKDKRTRGDTPANAGAPWNDSLDEQLRTAWNGDLTVSEIATKMERTVNSIRSRLKRAGIATAIEIQARHKE